MKKGRKSLNKSSLEMKFCVIMMKSDLHIPTFDIPACLSRQFMVRKPRFYKKIFLIMLLALIASYNVSSMCKILSIHKFQLRSPLHVFAIESTKTMWLWSIWALFAHIFCVCDFFYRQSYHPRTVFIKGKFTRDEVTSIYDFKSSQWKVW
jgi:hypothetical protein